jgi:hypothetical protein
MANFYKIPQNEIKPMDIENIKTKYNKRPVIASELNPKYLYIQ